MKSFGYLHCNINQVMSQDLCSDYQSVDAIEKHSSSDFLEGKPYISIQLLALLRLLKPLIACSKSGNKRFTCSVETGAVERSSRTRFFLIPPPSPVNY